MTRRADVDVLVLGFGVAGASAAITAHDAGAGVLVAEKLSDGGGNCLNYGGFLFDVDGPHAVDHLDALCFGKTPRSVLEAFIWGQLTEHGGGLTDAIVSGRIAGEGAAAAR